MKYGATASVLKPLDELTLPDPRIGWEPLFQGIDDSAKVLEIHERINKYSSLHTSVPESIKSQFEIARNLMLYTYFVFEFQTQAELQAYAALEYALRERLGRPTRDGKSGKVAKPLMLRALLEKAVAENLIQPETLPSWTWANDRRKWFAENYGHPYVPLTGKDWLEDILKLVTDLRNHIAHGNPHLYLPNSFNQIELCADIINALFSNRSVHEPKAET